MLTKLIYLFCATILFCAMVHAGTAGRDKAMGSYEDVQTFINNISSKYKLDKAAVQAVFDKTYFDYSVTALLDKPAEYRPWTEYSAGVVSKDRIAKGQAYMETHSKHMAATEKKYGIPANVITSIIGIESTYGTATFKRDAVESIGTIAFEYPRRADYFKAELENLFILAKQENVSPKDFMGSYAGALGIPQFMPSSALKYAVDGDADGKVNIISDHPDAIASVANYLKENGWKPDKNIAATVSLSKTLADSYYSINPCNSKGSRTLKEWNTLGVKIPTDYAESDKAHLARLDEDIEKGTFTNVLLLENACAVHKYNRSLKYITVVAMLADAVK